jgi:hypothetical protein
MLTTAYIKPLESLEIYFHSPTRLHGIHRDITFAGQGPLVASFDSSNETSDSIKCGEFFE